jgi:hypothetical protein
MSKKLHQNASPTKSALERVHRSGAKISLTAARNPFGWKVRFEKAVTGG